eukprot:Sspe_Gene.19505::Locus_7116_Transcript_1_1_Confidence_1.000_Length_3662::g.19505::m.19505
MLSFREYLSIDSRVNEGIRCQLEPEATRPLVQYIVGIERDGVILVARHDYDKDGAYKTFLDFYDTNAGSAPARQQIFKQSGLQANGTMIIMAASLSSDKSILAVTVRNGGVMNESAIHESTNTSEYECWLISVKGNEHFVLRANGRYSLQQFPRVQFLSTDSKPGKSHPSFLYILDKEKIEVYSLLMHSEKKTDHLERSNGIVESHLWSQYIPHSNLLFVLLKQRNGRTKVEKGSTSVSVECSLRCYRPGKRLETIFEINLTMWMNPRTLIPVSQQPTAYFTYPWLNGTASPDASLRLQVVTMLNKVGDGQNVVLCQQHLDPIDTSRNPNIKISLFCFRTRHCMNITASLDPAQIRPNGVIPPVFFGSLKRSIVVLYLPNHFVHLVDVQHRNRPPRHLIGCNIGAFAEVPASSPNLGGCPRGLTEQALRQHNRQGGLPPPAQRPTYDTDPSSGAQRRCSLPLFGSIRTHHGQLMVNLSTGVLFHYELNDTVLYQWFCEVASPDLYPAVMHLLLAHFHDMPSFTSRSMLSELCSNAPDRLTPELLKEYIMGTAYARVRDSLPSEKDVQDFLDILQYTTLNSRQSTAPGCRISVFRLCSAPSAASERIHLQLPVPIERAGGGPPPSSPPHDPRLSWASDGTFLLAPPPLAASEVTSQPREQGGLFSALREKLASVTGVGSAAVAKAAQRPEPCGLYETVRCCLEDGLVEQLVRGHRLDRKVVEGHSLQQWPSMGRQKATAFASEYIKAVQHCVDGVMDIIQSTLHLPPHARWLNLDSDSPVKPRAVYAVLHSVCTALEDLSFPRTDLLNHHLAFAAFKSCSRRTFLQLVKRGTIFITPHLLDELRKDALRSSPPPFPVPSQPPSSPEMEHLLSLLSRVKDQVLDDSPLQTDINQAMLAVFPLSSHAVAVAKAFGWDASFKCFRSPVTPALAGELLEALVSRNSEQCQAMLENEKLFTQLTFALSTPKERVGHLESHRGSEEYLLQHFQSLLHRSADSPSSPSDEQAPRGSLTSTSTGLTGEEYTTNFLPFEEVRKQWKTISPAVGGITSPPLEYARCYEEDHAANWIAAALSPLVAVKH